MPGEGKTTTAINLAITLADAGSRVALVDADLRRPSIASYLGLEGSVDLTTVLIGRASAADAIQPWGKGNLHMPPSGQVPPNPSELLGSRSMATLLEQPASQYDMVLIDTPALLPVTDAAILATVTGGALVVAGAGLLHRQQLADGAGSLQDVGARVLGVVLNRLARQQDNARSYNDYAAGPAGGQGQEQAPACGGVGPGADASHPCRHAPVLALRTGPSVTTETGRAAVPASGTDQDDPLALTAAGVDPEK